MKIENKFDFNKIPENTRFNTRLMVSLEADENSDHQEQLLNIAVVLDRSGSMKGEKIEYVKTATKILASQLNQNDILSLTVYDDEVNKLVPPAKMKDLHGFGPAVDSVFSGGMTFLSGGYEQGCIFAKENKSDKNISRVMLLTDGLANEGITDPDQLASIALKKNNDGITTTTIGVGKDYDESLLGKMAENGGGGTYYIENPDDAPSVFQEELGYLKSLVATNVVVKFVPNNHELTFDQLNTYRVNPDKSFLLGDLYSGQKKSIVLELLIPAMPVSNDNEIGTIEISYQDTSNNEIEEKNQSIPVTIDVVSSYDFENEIPNKDVTLEAAFLLVAKAKSEAIKLADESRYDDAAKILLQYADTLEQLNLNNSRLNNEINELRIRARNLQERREEFYTMSEKKRMFYESDKMAKANMVSYSMMKNRRNDDNNGFTTSKQYFVYVGQLKNEFWETDIAKKNNPDADSNMPCVYVGFSSKEPNIRWQEHLNGVSGLNRSHYSKVVNKYGEDKLLYKEFKQYNPVLSVDEARLAVYRIINDLRQKGHIVWTDSINELSMIS